jgi:osmoprotectant transport system ATP-binding protein
VIELEGVSKTYRGRDGAVVRAVDDVSLSVERGRTLCLIGTSGCGKTTTMKLINRLVEPTSGRVLVDGRDVREQDPIALRRSIGYVIQKGGLFPHMTVARNVGLLCELERWEEQRVAARVAELLALVNLPLETFGNRYPRELSGGQRQRVGVARALALDPPIVLMDEPFGALDPVSRSRIHDEFIELQRSMHKTIVMVTHDMAEAFKLADEVALMSDGKIVQRGTEADFRERPANAFVEAFLRA